MGKQNVYENGGMQVPLVIGGPGIAPGHTDAFAYLMDIFPTVCELLGTAVPQGIDGKSLAPILAGKANQVRPHVFTCYTDVQRSIRDQRWKLIRYPKINRSQLFDLQADPHEMKDLADEASQASKVSEMMALLAQTQREYGDTCALSSPHPAPAAWSPPPVAAEPAK